MINLNLVPLLKLVFEYQLIGDRIITLGRQKIGFDEVGLQTLIDNGSLPASALQNWNSDQETFLSFFGFSVIHSLDVSEYESCTHLFDLNSPTLPKELREKYSVVLDGGTLEHIFEVGNGIRSCIDMLEPGGLFIHIGPMNNWVDHGFYQFSPTLWFDFCAENNLTVEQSAIIDISPRESSESYLIRQVLPGEGNHLNQSGLRSSHMFVARKNINKLWKIPKQGMYLKKHDSIMNNCELRSLAPSDINNGIVSFKPRNLINIDLAKLNKIGRHTYEFFLPQTEALGGTPNRPFRSRILVLEQGKPLSHIVSDPDMIDKSRPGRFSHQLNKISFSTSDHSDPLTNGRSYQISVPLD